MTYTEMKQTFAKEIDFLQDLTAYEYGLTPIESEDEAAEMISHWIAEGIDDIPDGFMACGKAEVLMELWNTFITPSQEVVRRMNRESYVENLKAQHEDYLFFDYYYDNDETAIIDPEQLSNELRQLHYDNEHIRLIMTALRAYQKTYSENL